MTFASQFLEIPEESTAGVEPQKLSLLDLWEKSPETINSYSVQQIVSMSGDGKLRDKSECSREFRSFISRVSSEKLDEYIKFCLGEKFEKSGQVLQDLVNEVGRRLDYTVQNGLYAGTSRDIGNDGLWFSPEGQILVVEVKTSDAYRISLDTIARYRQSHIKNGEIEANNSSILIVVGRQDTGELEAQVRGSRHAWDVRLISAEALIKLAHLKEKSEDAETGRQIRSLLVPVEYTRVDTLVDVVFTTAQDVEDSNAELEPLAEEHDQSAPASRALQYSKKEIQEKRDAIVARLSEAFSASFVRKSRAMLWSPDQDIAIACTVSKRYPKGNPYWYAYHPSWREFLSQSKRGYFVLGCMDLNRFFAIPAEVMEEKVPQLNVTESGKQRYWHIQLRECEDGDIEMIIPHRESLHLENYAVVL